MIELVKEMFSYPFMIRALFVGILVSVYASLLGVSLVLKRYSMIVAMSKSDVILSIIISAIVLILFPV